MKRDIWMEFMLLLRRKKWENSFQTGFRLLSREWNGWIVSGYKEELPKPNREIGYAISNNMTGRGYATEAVDGLINFIFRNTTTPELVATARDYNLSSNAVIKKNGFIFEHEQEMDGHNYYCYRLKK